MNLVVEDVDKVMLTTDEDINDNPSDAYTLIGNKKEELSQHPEHDDQNIAAVDN